MSLLMKHHSLVGAGLSAGLPIYSKDNVWGFGDSYMSGQGASPSSNAFIQLLNTYIGGTYTGYSAGGRGLFLMAQNANTSVNLLTSALIVAMAGLNDFRRSGTNTKTDNKLIGTYTLLLMSAFAKKFYGTANWTEVGTWANVSITGARGTPTVLRNNTGDASITLTAPGKHFGFAFMGSDGTQTYGSVEIKIDGVTYHNVSLNNQTDGFSDGVINNQTCPVGFVVLGLAAGSHSIEIICTGTNCPTNYIVELGDPGADYLNKVLVSEIPRIIDYAASPSSGSDAIINAANILLAGVVNTFKSKLFPVEYVPVNNFIDFVNDFDPDNIHWDNSGHNNGYLGMRSQLRLLSTQRVFQTLKDIAFQGDFYEGRNANAWQAYGGSDIVLPASTDGWVQFTVPNNTDSNFGLIGFNTTKENVTYTSWEYGMAYNSVPAVYRLTNGAGYANVQSGLLAVGSKLRLERQSTNTIKIRYASDGVNFSDLYTFPGTSTSAMYLNIAFEAANKRAYTIETNGFI